MASPSKLSHLVFQTNQIAAMRDWYCSVLGAEIVHDAPIISFISYDDEHHRVAFLDPGPLAKRDPGVQDTFRAGAEAGLHHVAFTFAGLADLLETYERIKEEGILPYWCINHGPTTSMYYRDPDGNQVELQVDNFPDVRDCKAYMQGPEFARNPLGVEFDPVELGARLRAGVPEPELLRRA